MKATLEQIENLRIDALYGKKKHFNAADRKQNRRLWFNVPAIIINILIGSSLIGVFQESSPYYTKVILGVCAVIAAILTTLSTFLDYAKQTEGHRRVGNKYLAIVKDCERTLAGFKDKITKPEELISKMEKIAAKCEEANKEAEAFHTSKNDFKEAQQSIQAGEETYLDIEKIK